MSRHAQQSPMLPSNEGGGWAFFETALGRCAVAWSAGGIVAMQLPEADDPATQARLFKASGALPQAAPPAPVAQAIAAVQALLAGQCDASATQTGLQAVVLDMQRISAFQRRVYELTRCIAPGQTRTYGELASALGNKNSARAVGHALGLNPFAPLIPCHRVLAADGRLCGFSAHGGVATKMRMLQTEGALLAGQGGLLAEQGGLFDAPPLSGAPAKALAPAAPARAPTKARSPRPGC